MGCQELSRPIKIQETFTEETKTINFSVKNTMVIILRTCLYWVTSQCQMQNYSVYSKRLNYKRIVSYYVNETFIHTIIWQIGCIDFSKRSCCTGRPAFSKFTMNNECFGSCFTVSLRFCHTSRALVSLMLNPRSFVTQRCCDVSDSLGVRMWEVPTPCHSEQREAQC